MRYRCDDCGLTFDAKDAIEYYESDTGYGASLCPSCRADALVEIRECKFCGEDEDAFRLTIDGYCRACVKRTKTHFNNVLKLFEDEELKILKNEFEIYPIE